MPTGVKFFISLLLISLFSILLFNLDLVYADPPSTTDDGGALKCAITVTTTTAPGVTDKIFVDTTGSTPAPEPFQLDAHMTDLTRDHMFFASKGPYKAGIDYNLDPKTNQPYEDLLGTMKLIRSVPNNDERDLGQEDTTECIEHRNNQCVKFAESLDPGDQIDSWNIESTSDFTFGTLGHSSIRIYENDGQAVLNQNTMVCIKDVDVLPSYQLLISVTQPLYLGNQIFITGALYDHTKPVANNQVSLTIGARTVTTTTQTDGTYSYNSDTTQTWGIVADQQQYNIQAQATINGKKVVTDSSFGVNLAPPQSTYQLNPGNNPRISIDRYYNSGSKDYWTTTSLQQTTPAQANYTQDQPQGQVFTEDDGSGALTPLYDCLSGINHFNSIYLPNCPQYARVGYIYNPKSPQPSGTHPLYLCKSTTGTDERVSLNNNCKNDANDPDSYSLESLLGYALNNQSNCPDLPKQDVPVTGPTTLSLHQMYSDKLSQATINPPSNQTVETQAANSVIVRTGLSQGFLSVFGNIGCTFQSFLSILGIQVSFCPNSVQLGPRGTELFVQKSTLLNGSQMPKDLQRNNPAYNAQVIGDSEPSCEWGNKYLSIANQQDGYDPGNTYSTDIPDQFSIQSGGIVQGNSNQSVLGTSTTNVQLKGYLSPDNTINAGSKPVPSDDRTKPFDCNMLLKFQSVYYNVPNGYRPPGFESLKCPANQSQPPPAAAPATTLGGNGIDIGQPVDDSGKILVTDDLINRVVTTKAGWVRLNIRTEKPYGSDTSKFYSDYDQIISKLQAKNLQIMAVMANEAWHGSQSQWTDNNTEIKNGDGSNKYIQDYTSAFVRMAKHWNGKINYWEIWNEPDGYTSGDYNKNGDPYQANLSGGTFIYPSNFAAMLSSVSKAAQSNNLNVKIISGGLFGNDIHGLNSFGSGADYLNSTYDYGFQNKQFSQGNAPFNFVGQHIYIEQGSSVNTGDFGQYLDFVHNIVAKRDSASKQTWVTEFGWTREKSMSQATQASNLTAGYGVIKSKAYVAKGIWFQLDDHPDATLLYGLYDSNQKPKQSLSAFQNLK